ncbi:oil body-associated protein 2B-like [Diospyros lotus]|uniref:oil body-associated protein 2B-like n=1 Tax=Diospyros lotus TaxID=55363 RepID=UPI00225939BF|nr:oil body-associated protein 2B-like [Diospyros lotus]
MLNKGAELLQSLKPVGQMKRHVCSFALYSHDMSRQIETHHFLSRRNQDFFQCAVYDSDDDAWARFIGVEYMISGTLFETLSPEEQKFWHSHAYEIKSGLWIHPWVPEMILKHELLNLAKTYGKFWCTCNIGDRLPLGPPALMVSPQAVNVGLVRQELVAKRSIKYNDLTDDLKASRLEIAEPEWINPQADYWNSTGVASPSPLSRRR